MEKSIEPVDLNIPPYEWLKEARIFNHKFARIPNTWIMDKVDAIVLYFSMRNADRNNIIREFYEIYENARYNNLPIEVINIPMDESKEDMLYSYDDQANWFTLMFNDPLIPTLQYRHCITSVPHLLVMRTDGTIVSSHGILDLDVYGKNALVAWMSTSAASTKPKRLSKELSMYGPVWKYLTIGGGEKPSYRRMFSEMPAPEEPSTSIEASVRSLLDLER